MNLVEDGLRELGGRATVNELRDHLIQTRPNFCWQNGQVTRALRKLQRWRIVRQVAPSAPNRPGIWEVSL
jgi:hypothetical protein